MGISRSAVPSWTAKERLYVVLIFIAAGLAGYGALRLASDVFIGVAAFVVALAFMLKGLDAMQKERIHREIRARDRDS